VLQTNGSAAAIKNCLLIVLGSLGAAAAVKNRVVVLQTMGACAAKK